MKILIIDDSEALAKKAQKQLNRQFTVEYALSAMEGISLLRSSPFDLVLLDLMMPEMDGREACRRIKDEWPEIPVVMLSGVGLSPTKTELLLLGADDYVTKPFETPELAARILAVLRRRKNSTFRQSLQIGLLQINLERRTVYYKEAEVILRRKEFDILEYLCLNSGRVLTRDMIISQAWPSDSGGWTGSVDVHIKQLRDKIDRPFGTQLIRTVYGVGYMLDAPELTPIEQPSVQLTAEVAQ